MIHRIVLIKLHDDFATDAGRRHVVEQTQQMLAHVPGIQELNVGVAADPKSEASWDISIFVQFKSLADMEAYLPHPEHRQYVDEFLKPRMTFIKAWNFRLDD